MKISRSIKYLSLPGLIALAVAANCIPLAAQALTVTRAASGQVGASAQAGGTNKEDVVIESIEPAEDSEPATAKEIAWLGISTGEVPEALAAQLDLKTGQGLVVTYIEDQSPAAKAGLQKNDVIIEFNGQMLVHPAQLKKLVQMQEPGDTVKLVLFREAKKQEVSATLGKTKAQPWLGDFGPGWMGLHKRLDELPPLKDTLRREMDSLRKALSRAGIDQESLQREIRRSLEAARRGMDEALRNATNAQHTFGPAMRTLKELAKEGVVVDNDATVTVKSHSKSVKSIVKTDDSGTYVLVADPKKQLTAHDKEGQLLFDGPVETPQQQAKVPPQVWDKVKPMIEQLGSTEHQSEP